MTIFYHASNKWFKQPNPSYVKTGPGHDTNGQGLYLARTPERAQDHINDKNWKNAIIYVTDIDIDDKKIYNPKTKNPTEFNNILAAITKVTGKPIFRKKINSYKSGHQNTQALYNASYFMDICGINKQEQNKIYYEAGYIGHIAHDEDSICLTDTKFYPTSTNWHVHSIIGNGPHNMPASIKNKYTQTSSSAPANNPIPKTNNKIP